MAKHKELNKLCRLCLKQSDALENIFGTNDNNSLVLRIMASVSLEIHKNDKMPKRICLDCRYQLEKTYIFRSKCRDNDIKLKHHIKMLAAGKGSSLLDELEDDEEEYEQGMEFIRKVDKANELEKEQEWNSKLSVLKEEFQALRDLERSTIHEEVKQELLFKHQSEMVDASTYTGEMNSSGFCSDMATDVYEDEEVLLDPIIQDEDIKGTIAIASENEARVDEYVDRSEPEQDELRECTSKEDIRAKIKRHVLNRNREMHYMNEERLMEIDETEDGSSSAITVVNEAIEPSCSESDNITVSEIPTNTDQFVITEISDTDTYVLENDLKREQRDLYGSDADSDEDLEAVTNAVKAELAHQPGFNIGENCVMKVEKDGELTKVEVRANDGSIIHMEFSTEPKQRTAQLSTIVKTKTAGVFNCTQCPQSFDSGRQLTTHVTLCHTDVSKGLVCDVCQKWCRNKSALERHYRSHTGEKPFSCNECGKSFVQKEILKRHMLLHSDEKPYPCDQCSKRYNQKDQLKHHMNMYHSENPVIVIHKCSMCDKEFKYASGLSRHLATHFGRTFPCFCGREFSDKSALKRHEVGVHAKGKGKEAASTVNPDVCN